MSDKEEDLYRRARVVSAEKFLHASKTVMHAAAQRRFAAENEARRASIAQATPVHDAMRAVVAKCSDYHDVGLAMAAAERRRPLAPLTKPFVPAAPKVPRLKLGSVHLVDTAPFMGLTWQDVQVFNGPPDNPDLPGDSPPPVIADGSTGDMSFDIRGGGWNVLNSSTVGCWSAIGQAYVMPPDAGKPGIGGAMLRFSATPSFNWAAEWMSSWWRLAWGNIWIGQVVNRFDQNGTAIDTPVSYQTSLVSWSDSNFGDNGQRSESTTALGLSTWVFVQPEFVYNAWVWVGATASADTEAQLGWSFCEAQMTANVSTLIFDTF